MQFQIASFLSRLLKRLTLDATAINNDGTKRKNPPCGGRAYKKWAEMLLHPEISSGLIRGATLYLDRLRILYGYDVLSHLQERFRRDYTGLNPYIAQFQHTDSALDANQCLQLCDLLTGCLYQSLVPSKSQEKLQMQQYLESVLKAHGVKHMGASFWKQYAPNSLTKHLPNSALGFGDRRNKRGSQDGLAINADPVEPERSC